MAGRGLPAAEPRRSSFSRHKYDNMQVSIRVLPGNLESVEMVVFKLEMNILVAKTRELSLPKHNHSRLTTSDDERSIFRT
jgi:hypothetical protein